MPNQKAQPQVSTTPDSVPGANPTNVSAAGGNSVKKPISHKDLFASLGFATHLLKQQLPKDNPHAPSAPPQHSNPQQPQQTQQQPDPNNQQANPLSTEFQQFETKITGEIQQLTTSIQQLIKNDQSESQP